MLAKRISLFLVPVRIIIRTKFQRIDDFIELGLVEYKKEDDDPHNSGSLYLTEDGKKIAEHLKKAREIVIKHVK